MKRTERERLRGILAQPIPSNPTMSYIAYLRSACKRMLKEAEENATQAKSER